MKNLIVLIIVTAIIYLGLAYMGVIPSEYVPAALKENVPQLANGSEDVPPLEERMHGVAKKLLSPISENSSNLGAEIQSLRSELQNKKRKYSPEAVTEGLRYFKQLQEVNARKAKFIKACNEIRSRKEIKSIAKGDLYNSKKVDLKAKLIEAKEYEWSQVVTGVTPPLKKQFETFLELLEK